MYIYIYYILYYVYINIYIKTYRHRQQCGKSQMEIEWVVGGGEQSRGGMGQKETLLGVNAVCI